MKALLLLTTIWIGLVSLDLPIVNTLPDSGGKCIKDHGISPLDFFPPDSSHIYSLFSRPISPSANYQINTVVIDPGHGGHDPGCSGHSSREKNIVLAIGKYLAEGLKAQYPGLKVIMTRSTDVFVPLHERAAIATEHKADLFISLHCNAFSKSFAQGTETYVLGLHATKENLEVAKRENEAILLEENYQENYGYDPNSPEAHILFSMFQNAFLEQSIAFAEKVQGRAKDQAGMKDRGVKQAGFLVLRYATMPSVLVETGYLTNEQDEAFLTTVDGQIKMASAILHAFGEYKSEMEGTEYKEAPATVAYFEVKKNEPITYTSPNSLQAKPAAPAPSQKTVSSSSPLAYQESRPNSTSPEPTPEPIASGNTNTSPRKNGKIAPTIPIEEKLLTEAPAKAENQKIAILQAEEPSSQPAVAKPTTPTANAGIQFCVQLSASPTLLDVSTGKWLRIDQTVEVIKEGNLYKYQVRNFASEKEAMKARADLRSKGFYDAFVVAYRNGVRVDPRTLK